MVNPTPQLSLDPMAFHRPLMDAAVQRLAFSARGKGVGLAAWQKKLRRKVTELAGYDRFPAQGDRCPLRVRSLWKEASHHGLGSVEKIVFTAQPGADVPAYVCIPHAWREPRRWMVCLQGHSTGMHNSIAVDREREMGAIRVEGDRDFALGCMRRGIAALAIEQRSFGERTPGRERTPGPDIHCQLPAMRALMLGHTLLAERVFDVDRALDYLATRADADPTRIGVMGNSGGGLTTIFAAALLPRVAFAMPSCSFCTYRDSIMSITHCTDNYVPHLFQWAESADVLGLFAPRPVVAVAGRIDRIFPINGVKRAFADLQKIYRAAGAADRCRLVIGDEGHRFYAQPAWKAMLELLDAP